VGAVQLPAQRHVARSLVIPAFGGDARLRRRLDAVEDDHQGSIRRFDRRLVRHAFRRNRSRARPPSAARE
jgi:hypothetical protein